MQYNHNLPEGEEFVFEKNTKNQYRFWTDEAFTLFRLFGETHGYELNEVIERSFRNQAREELRRDITRKTIHYAPRKSGVQFRICITKNNLQLFANYGNMNSFKGKELFRERLAETNLEYLLTNHPDSSAPFVSEERLSTVQDQQPRQPAPSETEQFLSQ